MHTVLILKHEVRITYGHTLKVNSSLVFRGFANLRDRPKNKEKSLGPFSGLGHQNISQLDTGRRGLTHDAQGVEGKNMQLP